MKKKKRMNLWFYAIFWLSRQKLASTQELGGRAVFSTEPKSLKRKPRLGRLTW